MALKDQGTYPLRLFDLMTETVLGGKDIIYQPVMRMFHWTIPIQFFQSQVGFPPELIPVIVIIELLYFIGLCLEIFNITLMSKTILF